MYRTSINIVPSPVEYTKLVDAYSSIKNQYNSHYVCRVIDMEIADKEIYYIDVKEKHTGNFVGYLGEYADTSHWLTDILGVFSK